MLKSVTEAPNALCSFCPLVSRFLADTVSMRSKSRIALDRFCTSAATQFNLVLYTSAVIMALYTKDLRTKKTCDVQCGGFAALPVLSLVLFSDENAHIG